jgi:hypothetical protein
MTQYLVFNNQNTTGLGTQAELIVNWANVKYIQPDTASTFILELNSGANLTFTLGTGVASAVITAIQDLVKSNPTGRVLKVTPPTPNAFQFSSIVYNNAAAGTIDGIGAQYEVAVFTDPDTITGINPIGAAGDVLTSGGAGVYPTWAAGGGGSPYEVGAGTDSAQLVAGTNTAAGDYSVVAGGVSNCAPNTACYQTISGGFTNLAEGAYAAIGGGLMNCELPQAGGPGYNTIAGGSENVITGLGGGFIGGGQKNYQIEDNALAKSGLWAIGGGGENLICNPTGTSGGILGATIAGGFENTIIEDVAGKSMETPTIGGGGKNCIYGVEKNGTIAGGGSNTLDHADAGAIAGGSSNEIVLAKQGFIGGGDNNSIPAGSDESTIVGGINNDAAGFSNVHIIGSNITATRTGTTYVGGFNIGQAVPLTAYADNAAALLGGLTIGDVYRQTTTAGGDLLGIVH